MAEESSKIKVHPMTQKPTQLWDKIKVKGENKKQKKLNVEDYVALPKEQKPGHVRFVLVSDTHSQTDNLEMPEGDILIHAGDFSNVGKPGEIDKFNEFLGRIQPKYKHLIVIAGNHELTFDPFGAESAGYLLPKDCLGLDHKEMKKKLTNCTFIEDQAVEVMGFKIYGSPWQPEFGGWAYNLKRGADCLEKWDLIPDDTDILVTHGPPLGYGDHCSSQMRAGCAELLSTIQNRVKPMIHVFGHIHEAYGIWTDSTTTYINASTCTLRYKPSNKPIIMDLKPPEKK
eukprot:TCONS_00004697-protein